MLYDYSEQHPDMWTDLKAQELRKQQQKQQEQQRSYPTLEQLYNKLAKCPRSGHSARSLA